MKKQIALFSLGGTISAKGRNRTDLKDYVSGKIQGAELIRDFPELHSLANIEVIDLDGISSTQINERHWITLKEKIETYLHDKNFDGIVISHGTSTLEETAYFLHLTVNTDKPIVLVGAQRPYTALSTDAPLNLLNAFQVVVHPDSYGKGVLVVSHQEIHSARDVTKRHTYRLNTFQSGEVGLLGVLDGDLEVQYYRTPIRAHTKESAFCNLSLDPEALPKVEIIYSYAGATGRLIQSLTEQRLCTGIVVAGTGAGRFSKAEEKALQKASEEGIYIVRSSRVGLGRVIPIKAYEHLPTISADNLLPQKARILLMLSLLKTKKPSTLQKLFEKH